MSRKCSVMSVFGTRPEAVKMAPLVRRLDSDPDIESLVCVTGQHRQMLDQILGVFNIRPDYDLEIMTPRQTLADIASRTLSGMDKIFAERKPDLVLVHGDPSAAFCTALAAFYHQIPVGHVEAGLRTGDRYSPFPEEANRQLIARLASLHFCATRQNRDNLISEGTMGDIFVTGNTVIDALGMTVRERYEFHEPLLRAVDFTANRVVFVTLHRRENYGAPLEAICRAIITLRNMYPDLVFVYPVHFSPAVRDTVMPILSGQERIILSDPIDPLDAHNFMARCHFVLTDSGGLQEEAPSLGKPVLVARRETERPEAVEAGTVRLAGVEYDKIIELSRLLLDSPEEYSRMAKSVNPYGDGHATERITAAVRYYFGLDPAPPSPFLP